MFSIIFNLYFIPDKAISTIISFTLSFLLFYKFSAMRNFFTLLVCLLPTLLFAQVPQFAVVRPNGTTFICPTWDSAYNTAQSGDNIYLPGVTLTQSLVIDKRLNIYGAGHHPDSSNAVGKTSLSSGQYISILSNASGGSLEGIQVSTNDIFFTYVDKKIQNFVIKRCKAQTVRFTNGPTPTDSLPTNILITECILAAIDGSGSSGINISKNLIEYAINSISGSSINNNIFNYTAEGFMGAVTTSLFENNIFLSNQPFSNSNSNTCTNSFYNNLKIIGCPALLCGCPANTGTEVNTISEASVSNIFLSYQYATNYPYGNNYHLKATCIGKNAGVDGTDVGIYGTSQPTSEGWVPSNPHIYSKQIDANTTSDGKLKVKFKVRTNQ